MNKKVSIILPCYNVAQYINDVYENIVGSTYTNIEIIFVDDGSIDSTITKIRTITDPRVKVISKENGGVSSARNCGIEAATGEYIMFIDPDDLIFPNTIELAVSKAEETGAELVLYGFRREMISDNDSKDFYPLKEYSYTSTEEIIHGFMPAIIGISSDTIALWQNGGNLYWNKEWGAVWRALYRRDIIINNDVRFDTNLFLNEDTIFNCHYICHISRMETINKCLYRYRVIGANSIILKGSHVGEGSIIGAGSVICGKIPPYEIWAGNPARFIKKAQ